MSLLTETRAAVKKEVVDLVISSVDDYFVNGGSSLELRASFERRPHLRCEPGAIESPNHRFKCI